jgi:hypothetical protein
MFLTEDVDRAVASARASRAEAARTRQSVAEARLAAEWQRARAQRALSTLEQNLEAVHVTCSELSNRPFVLQWTTSSRGLDDVLFLVD